MKNHRFAFAVCSLLYVLGMLAGLAVMYIWPSMDAILGAASFMTVGTIAMVFLTIGFIQREFEEVMRAQRHDAD